jgi:hypothetical protein
MLYRLSYAHHRADANQCTTRMRRLQLEVGPPKSLETSCLLVVSKHLMRSRSIRALLCVIAVAIVLLAGFLASAQDSGLVLLHKMQRALGGSDKIAAIHDLDWTVRAKTFDHNGRPIGSVTKRTRWIRPNYLRLDQVGPGDTYVLYFEGTRGWESCPTSGY